MYQVLKLLPPEAAHKVAIWGLKHGLGPTIKSNPKYQNTLFGKPVPNLIGLSAGFDKQAEALAGIFKLGFGFIEAGSVAPERRPGNTFRPRHWRRGNAAINAYGLNSVGLESFARNLEAFRRKHGEAPLVGASLVNPPGSTFPVSIFYVMAGRLNAVVDYFTINFSCPNSGDEDRSLDALWHQVEQTVKGANGKPVLVKLGPFFQSDSDRLRETVRVAMDAGANGFIATNTLTHAQATQEKIFTSEFLQKWPRNDKNEIAGGYSGRQLAPIGQEMIRQLRILAPNAILIGVGGVQEDWDAQKYYFAGANAVQLLTGLAIRGPALMRELVQHSMFL